MAGHPIIPLSNDIFAGSRTQPSSLVSVVLQSPRREADLQREFSRELVGKSNPKSSPRLPADIASSPNYRFGKPTEISTDAKTVLYPGRLGMDSANPTLEAGHQVDRHYVWNGELVGVNLATHRFGTVKPVTNIEPVAVSCAPIVPQAVLSGRSVSGAPLGSPKLRGTTTEKKFCPFAPFGSSSHQVAEALQADIFAANSQLSPTKQQPLLSTQVSNKFNHESLQGNHNRKKQSPLRCPPLTDEHSKVTNSSPTRTVPSLPSIGVLSPKKLVDDSTLQPPPQGKTANPKSFGAATVRIDLPTPREGGKKLDSAIDYGDELPLSHVISPRKQLDALQCLRSLSLDDAKKLNEKCRFGLTDQQVVEVYDLALSEPVGDLASRMARYHTQSPERRSNGRKSDRQGAPAVFEKQRTLGEVYPDTFLRAIQTLGY